MGDAMRWAAPLLLASCMLTGCGGSSEYSDVLELRDAAVDAGLDCPDWERTSDEDTKATGACSDDAVLILYRDADGRKTGVAEMVKTHQEFNKMLGADVPQTLLVGDNWVINSPDAADLADDLGGEVIDD
jgi:hypothetical protein